MSSGPQVFGFAFIWFTVVLAGQTTPKTEELYGRLSAAFEPSGDGFVSRAPGALLQVSGTMAELYSPAGAVRMRLDGATGSTRGEGLDRLPGSNNYYAGKDPSQWRVNVPTFARVRYAGVYPGIDVVYHGSRRRLEYDFHVAPGADPAAIRLVFDRVRSLDLAHGILVLRAPGGEVRHLAPLVYQERDGVRSVVDCRYKRLGRRTVGFVLGPYDRSRPLVIDPVLSYSTYLGGSSGDLANAVTVDATGAVYVTGATQSTNFPTSAGAQQTTNRGSYDVFVAKVNPAGSALVFSTYLGGSSSDSGNAIALDASGNIYITGRTESMQFPTTAGSYKTTFSGIADAFVAKLSASGALVYSTYLGGTSVDQAYAIAVDSTGSTFVTGSTGSSAFPTTAGALRTTFGGGVDGFVTKLNPTGSALTYSTYLGGSSDDVGAGIAVDSSGNAFVAGHTYSSNFPVTSGAVQTTSAGVSDAFIVKLNPAGTSLVYGTYLGGISVDRATALALDASGNASVAGSTTSSAFPTTAGAFQTASKGGYDAFVAKLNPAGSALVYSTYVGGTARDEAFAIAVDPAGQAYVAGDTTSTDFPVAIGIQKTRSGNVDAFFARINETGTALVYSTYLGGSSGSTEKANGIAVDRSGLVYLVGETAASDFPRSNALQGTYGGGSGDAFISKIDFVIQPRLSTGGVVHAASFLGGAVAPGEIVSIFGTDIGPFPGIGAGLDASGCLSKTVGETRVLFDGVAAPLFYVSNDQVNVQVPFSVAGKSSSQVQVKYKDLSSNTLSVPVAASAPGLFALAAGKGPGVVLREDLSLNSASNPSPPGTVVTFYATGEGQTDPPGVDGALAGDPYPRPVLPVTMTIGGQPAELLYAGAAPGFAGLMQINARVPAGLAASATSEVVLSVGGGTSQPGLTMAVGLPIVISNLRAGPSTNAGSGANLPITVDFSDPSASLSSGTVTVKMNVADGSITGQITTNATSGVTPGQTTGTLTVRLYFPFTNFVRGRIVPITISFKGSGGLESNPLTGTFETQ